MNPNNENAVDIEDVHFYYDEHRPLLNIPCFSIPKGSFVSILGPSGSGKTTLLFLLSGFLKPISGTIKVFNVSSREVRDSGYLSYMFQNPTLIPWRTAIENVILPYNLMGKQVNIKKVHATLEMVGLDKESTKYPDQLSGGMRSRVALAQALITDPKLLLLDEPLGDLDEVTRIRLALAISHLQKELKMTIIMVTHNIHDAIMVSDSIVLFQKKEDSSAYRINHILPIKFPNKTLDCIKTSDFQSLYAKIVQIFSE